MLMKSEYIKLLKTMDETFSDLFIWLAGQYDSLTGGFYYARSSMEDHRFTPDIESSSQALNILLRNDVLFKLPHQVKSNMIHFFQSKQQQGSGYFYDENPAMKKDEVMVHRAINYSTGALKRLGSVPLYPLPLHSDTAPDYAKTPEAYLEKWKQIDLTNSWRGCDLLSASCVYIGEMEEKIREPFIHAAVNYLGSIQDQTTGLWGEGDLYVRISGTFKLHTFYSRFNIPMPHTDLIYNSILKCLRTEVAMDMCYVRNPINLLAYMDVTIPDQELKEIIEITVTNMKKFKREDGAFSRELYNSPKAPNVAQVKDGEYYPDMPEPVSLGRGLMEGDMNASTQATLIRLQCYQLAGLRAEPLNEADDFLTALKR